jgi:hypothetical protein
MGQFTNQPDFAVMAKMITPSDDIIPENFLNKAALYISDASSAANNLTVRMTNFDGQPEDITFKNITKGTFLPICVDYVLATGTSVTRLVAYR